MSQWDKLIKDIMNKKANLRFEDLAKALIKIGYTMEHPRSGSSHYTFRKKNKLPITIPKKKSPIDKVYIELVNEAVKNFNAEEDL